MQHFDELLSAAVRERLNTLIKTDIVVVCPELLSLVKSCDITGVEFIPELSTSHQTFLILPTRQYLTRITRYLAAHRELEHVTILVSDHCHSWRQTQFRDECERLAIRTEVKFVDCSFLCTFNGQGVGVMNLEVDQTKSVSDESLGDDYLVSGTYHKLVELLPLLRPKNIVCLGERAEKVFAKITSESVSLDNDYEQLIIVDREIDTLAEYLPPLTYGGYCQRYDDDPIYEEIRYRDFREVATYFQQKAEELSIFEKQYRKLPIDQLRIQLKEYRRVKAALEYHVQQLSELYRTLNVTWDQTPEDILASDDITPVIPIDVILRAIAGTSYRCKKDLDDICYQVLQQYGARYLPTITRFRTAMDKHNKGGKSLVDNICSVQSLSSKIVVLVIGNITNDEIAVLRGRCATITIIANSVVGHNS